MNSLDYPMQFMHISKHLSRSKQIGMSANIMKMYFLLVVVSVLSDLVYTQSNPPL